MSEAHREDPLSGSTFFVGALGVIWLIVTIIALDGFYRLTLRHERAAIQPHCR